MADPFLAEIRIVGFNFPPNGWAFCDGQLMPISQNTALFALLGTNYGGDGKSTFGLPDLRGRAPMHPQHDGWPPHYLGEEGGSSTVTLIDSELPAHSHTLRAATLDSADTSVPGPDASFAPSSGGTLYQAVADTQLGDGVLAPAGGGQPHNNMQPYLTLNFCIALQGEFPQRP